MSLTTLSMKAALEKAADLGVVSLLLLGVLLGVLFLAPEVLLLAAAATAGSREEGAWEEWAAVSCSVSCFPLDVSALLLAPEVLLLAGAVSIPEPWWEWVSFPCVGGAGGAW